MGNLRHYQTLRDEQDHSLGNVQLPQSSMLFPEQAACGQDQAPGLTRSAGKGQCPDGMLGGTDEDPAGKENPACHPWCPVRTRVPEDHIPAVTSARAWPDYDNLNLSNGKFWRGKNPVISSINNKHSPS